MKYCPACNTEYFDTVNRCADCGGDLVSQEEYQRIKRKEKEVLQEEAEFEKILILENQFEADVVSEALRQEGMDFLVTRNEDTAYNGIFIFQRGWGTVGVHPRDVDRAKSIVEFIIRSREAKEKPQSNSPEEENNGQRA